MPFRHVVMFKWNDDVDADHVELVRARLSTLPSAIDEIRSYVHGSDVGVSDGNYDYVVVADFDDVDDFQTYRDHPDHVLMIDDLIKGRVAERAAVQYETSSH
ncbi:MAG: Dabb family protein [Ilumatobacteraceae bacterium]